MHSRSTPWLALALGLVLAPASALADSPLTSTDFHLDYANVPAVAHASTRGLDAQTIALLRDPAVPHDLRAAVVNALGWSMNGQNARTFASAIAQAHGVAPASLRASDLSPEEAFALGYMAALDDYIHLSAIGGPTGLSASLPVELLEQAAASAPGDFSIAIVLALVRAQAWLGEPAGGCKAWSTVQTVLRAWGNPSMRPAAVRRIADYMNLYGTGC